jgi:hypothetical protein
MLLEMLEDLATVPAAAADIDNFPGIARLKYQTLLFGLPDNI